MQWRSIPHGRRLCPRVHQPARHVRGVRRCRRSVVCVERANDTHREGARQECTRRVGPCSILARTIRTRAQFADYQHRLASTRSPGSHVRQEGRRVYLAGRRLADLRVVIYT